MYTNEKVYEEDFVKRHVMNNPHSINYILEQMREVHPPEAGWVIGEPEITVNTDEKTVTIKVHLTKYSIEKGQGRSR